MQKSLFLALLCFAFGSQVSTQELDLPQAAVKDEAALAEARKSAARGYAGVVAYTRGKGRSPDTPTTYEYDGQDARTVIDWISKQLWSDGRVGMYSGSYNGCTQWAATKNLHPALKTIVPYVANNPGNGLPMENNVFLFVNY